MLGADHQLCLLVNIMLYLVDAQTVSISCIVFFGVQ